MTGEACGPHCGTKDEQERHCTKCHQRRSHGNAQRRNGQWEPR